MKRCAVIIGVNKTGGGLAVLRGAVHDANEVHEWAKKQGIETTLITDETEPVTTAAIMTAIAGYVGKGTYGQIIIYFAGHGMLKAPGWEMWLLSGAPGNANEAVNVRESIESARYSGIKHVIIYSDACRSLQSLLLMQVTGSNIFPGDGDWTGPAVDVFYATAPGKVAKEASETDAVKAHGLFTGCLLPALDGMNAEIVVQAEEEWIIPCRSLKDYLDKVVPLMAEAQSITYSQKPDIRIESVMPSYAAQVAKPSQQPTTRGLRGGERHYRTNTDIRGYTTRGSGAFPPPAGPTRTSEMARAVEEREDQLAAERLISAQGRQSFKTQTGFTVVGSQVRRVIVTGMPQPGPGDIFEESGAIQVRIPMSELYAGQSHSALLQLSGGNSIPLAVLPGFIGTIVVEQDNVANVAYVPSQNNPKYAQYALVAAEVEARRAAAAIASGNGYFMIQGKDPMEVAAYLRQDKAMDPTLGLYAAYAYSQAGDQMRIRDLYYYMYYADEPVLYDVALLARTLPGSPLPEPTRPISPFCPMLMQGWALIDPLKAQLPEAVAEMRRYLVPGLWTTFTPEGTELLWSSIEKGNPDATYPDSWPLPAG